MGSTSALYAGAYGGSSELILELLLEKAADVNAQGGEYGTALQFVGGYHIYAGEWLPPSLSSIEGWISSVS